MKNPRELPLAPLFAMLILTLLACGCRKSEREIAEENALKRHQEEVNPAHSSESSRVAMSNYLRTPDGKLMVREFGFLDGLKKNEQLPGVSKDVKGTMRREKKPSDLTSEGGCSQEFHYVTKDSPPQNFYYVIARASTNSPWQLKRAWQTDASGKVIQEFPVQ
jgi:hypothetical protein